MPAASTTPRADTVGAGWARERLWLGMSNVGLWVLVSIALVLLGPPTLGLGLADGFVLLGAYVLMQAPFDLVGGWWLQRRHDRAARPFGAFLAAWLRGVAVHSLVFAAAGASALALHAVGGPLAVFVGAAIGMLLLLGLQGPWIWLTTGLRTRTVTREEAGLAVRAGLDPDHVKIVDAHDPSFVGGWVGLPGAETLVVPAHWRHALTDTQWVTQLRRRQLTRSIGQRLRGVTVALLWNLAGLGGALMLFGAGDPGALFRTTAAYTLWSFLAVLVLPTLSRQGVHAVDRATREHGTSDSLMRDTLHRLDQLQDDEPARSEVVETLFHPVPALSRRIESLRRPVPPSAGAWHAARTSLLLSQAVASPISRAVPCNIGRPELWACYPGD